MNASGQDGDATEGDAACRLGVREADLMSMAMPLCSMGSLADVLMRNRGKKVSLP